MIRYFEKDNKMSSGFVAGTLVHTDKGLVPIQNLKVGDLVLSKNEFDGTKSFKPVENIFRYEQEEIFVLRFIDNFIEPDENDFFTPVMNLPNQKLSKIHLEFSAPNQKIWVNENKEQEISQGWRSVIKMTGREQFYFKDNEELGGVISVNNLCRTHIQDVFYFDSNGDYLPFVIDLRNQKIIIYYVAHLVLDAYHNQFNAEQHLPMAENIVIGDLDKHHVLNEIMNLIKNPSCDNFAKKEIYSLEIAENNNYFVGNLGILVGDSTIQGTIE